MARYEDMERLEDLAVPLEDHLVSCIGQWLAARVRALQVPRAGDRLDEVLVGRLLGVGLLVDEGGREAGQLGAFVAVDLLARLPVAQQLE